jgi:hypothetical protein
MPAHNTGMHLDPTCSKPIPRLTKLEVPNPPELQTTHRLDSQIGGLPQVHFLRHIVAGQSIQSDQ